ncbi:MAG TPA: hypothetical protein DCX07_01080 [Phycisphaerales bacterium]|nr:hypothetical protein [Phycisphaerales bacterium]
MRNFVSALTVVFLGIPCALLRGQSEPAEPVRWEGNGHYYQAVSGKPGGFTWYEADEAARKRVFQVAPGHLATIASAEENDFIVRTFPEAYRGAAWLGGYQPKGASEPAGGWCWVTGEPWQYTAWAPGEPNNSNFSAEFSHEDGLQYRSDPAMPWGSWNDFLRTRQSYPPADFYPGYVVEYDVPAYAQPRVKIHALLVGCEQRSKGFDYHGKREAWAMGIALMSLPNASARNIYGLLMDSDTENPRAMVLDAIRAFKPEVKAGETFFLFIGCHGFRAVLGLKVDPRDGSVIPGDENILRRSELQSLLMELDPQAIKVVVLPGCYTGSFWEALKEVPNICLFAGAPADEPSHIIPDLPWPPGMHDLAEIISPLGMTPLTVTMVTGLYRTPWGTSPADTNFDGLITFDELKKWVLSGNMPFLSNFRTWPEFPPDPWPVLDLRLGELAPFRYRPTVRASTATERMTLANSTEPPEASAVRIRGAAGLPQPPLLSIRGRTPSSSVATTRVSETTTPTESTRWPLKAAMAGLLLAIGLAMLLVVRSAKRRQTRRV